MAASEPESQTSVKPAQSGLWGFSWLAIGAAIAALVLQVIFAASYIGALHDPTPKDVPIGIVASDRIAPDLITTLSNGALKPRIEVSVDDLRQAIDQVEVYGGIVLTPGGVTLIVADAASLTAAQTLNVFAQGFAAGQNITLTVEHVHPLSPGDPRGLSTTYLVISWVFGGYFCATVLSTLRGTGYASRKHALLRIGLLAGYAVLSGLLGALVADTWIGAITGHFWGIALVGAFVVFAVAVATMGLQLVLGIAGTGIVLIAFVLIGNPASGGIVPEQFLPGFWRSVGPWLPNGAGFTLLRNVLYFDGNDITRAVTVLASYTLIGIVLLLVFAERKRPMTLGDDPESQLAAAAAAGI
jgi:hypothetical protein